MLEGDEVYYCGRCNRQYPLKTGAVCPLHPEFTMVIWDLSHDDVANALWHWKVENGLSHVE